MATDPQLSPTQKLMSVWRTSKPVIAQVHGWCVGGGSDFALSADLVVASEDAVIGTPYSRMWGAYLSGMWIYRLGLARAKYHALTGRPLTGRQAAEIELINEAVPFAALEQRVAALAAELASIPSSQLSAMKLVVNHAYENMGLAATQTLGPILDGLDAQHPRRARVHPTGRARRGERGRGRARRAVWRLQPGAAGAATRPRQRARALNQRPDIEAVAGDDRPPARQRRRRHPGQPGALTREVRLVGIATLKRDP